MYDYLDRKTKRVRWISATVTRHDKSDVDELTHDDIKNYDEVDFASELAIKCPVVSNKGLEYLYRKLFFDLGDIPSEHCKESQFDIGFHESGGKITLRARRRVKVEYRAGEGVPTDLGNIVCFKPHYEITDREIVLEGERK